jgi:hypothetical protein
MLARRWWWSCVYVAADVVSFVVSSLAGNSALAWRMGLGWLLLVGYVVVLAKTRTPRGQWGSRLRGELERPDFWRETRMLSRGRQGEGPGVYPDVVDAARRDASDWLSGIGITALCAVFFLAPAFYEPPASAAFPVLGGAFGILTVWGLSRARLVMSRLDRKDPTCVDHRQRSA